MLSDSDSDGGGGDDHQLTINEHFAKAYAHKKEREELSKLKDKYGSDAGSDGVYDSSDDSEEDETEDEDGEELTPAVDAAILRTLARIRRRDPGIYESGKGIFEEEEQKTKDAVPALTRSKTKDKTKPLLMRQHALQSAIDGGPSRSPSPGPNVPTHAEEQAALRRETVAAFHSSTSVDKKDGKAGGEDDDDDLDGFLVPREMTRDEAEVEQEEYRTFLARAVGEDIGELVTVEERVGEDGGEEGKGAKGEERKEGGKVDEKKTKKKKRKKGEGERKESDHEFLMNYILNRGWIDKSARHVPTFSEITASKSSKKSAKTGDKAEGEGAGVEAGDGGEEAGGLLDDEEFEEVADTFESSYNFRFEEPNATVIPTHPRNIDSLVRREDSARKEARERKKQRKEEKLLKKREEVRRMRALKMKEVRQKLERIGKEGGKSVDDEAFAELDLEGDWDPEKHDQQMAGIYGGDEQLEEDADDVDVEKPTWDDDIDITDIVPPVPATQSHVTSKSKTKRKKKKKGDEEAMDLDGVDVDAMDADVEMPVVDEEEEWDGTEEMRKQKLDEYMDELYGLEFNDMVGDLPTRFKYTPVAGQTFGLTPAEILLATDAELNQYMGVKKYAPYRRTGAWDANRGERLHELKGKVRSRADELGGFGGLAGDRREDGEQRPAKKRKGKKERTKAKLKNGDADVADGGVVEKSLGEGDTDGRGDGGLAKKRRRQKKSGGEVES